MTRKLPCALLFTVLLMSGAASATSEESADEVQIVQPCLECKDKTDEHTANDTNQYCWRLGVVSLPDNQGRCPPGWRKETIGQQSARFNRHIDKCDVAAAIAEPPFCDAGCFGYASIVKRKVTATTCYIKKKRDCKPIGRCEAQPLE